jgi:hypothetical protein
MSPYNNSRASFAVAADQEAITVVGRTRYGLGQARWIVAAVAALAIGAIGAKPYARMAAPYYLIAAELLAQGHPWEVAGVDVQSPAHGPGSILELTGTVRKYDSDILPAAIIAAHLEVAAVVQAPIIFWTVLLAWPAASVRQRFARVALGIPLFLGLEVATTVCQLLNPLACASAVLAGDPEPITPWESWSRFLEDGGRVVMALSAAMLTAALTVRSRREFAA